MKLNNPPPKSISDMIYNILDSMGTGLKNFGKYLRSENTNDPAKVKSDLSKLENELSKTKGEISGDNIPDTKDNKKVKTFFQKLVDLYNSFLDKIKTGFHYLALSLILLAFITLVSLMITGGKFHIFIRGVSNIFESVIKFFKNVFYGIIKGALTLSPTMILNEIADQYEKMIKNLSKVFNSMKSEGINESAFPIVIGLSVGGFLAGHMYIQEELYGES
jgi:hypothetical protein